MFIVTRVKTHGVCTFAAALIAGTAGCRMCSTVAILSTNKGKCLYRTLTLLFVCRIIRVGYQVSTIDRDLLSSIHNISCRCQSDNIFMAVAGLQLPVA